jgi:hypothetical protein
MFKDLETYYGALEWSQDQMAFHFSRPGDREAPGWDVVIENIHFDTSSAFITFLNYNWKERQKLPASEIRKMFDTWMLTQEGGLGNG